MGSMSQVTGFSVAKFNDKGVYSVAVESGKTATLPGGLKINDGVPAAGFTAKAAGQWHSTTGLTSLSTQGTDKAIAGRTFNIQFQNKDGQLQFRYVDREYEKKTTELISGLQKKIDEYKDDPGDLMDLQSQVDKLKADQESGGASSKEALAKAEETQKAFDQAQAEKQKVTEGAAPASTDPTASPAPAGEKPAAKPPAEAAT